MNITNLLKIINEMQQTDVSSVYSSLKNKFAASGFALNFTSHFERDRLIKSKDRQNILPDDIRYTLNKFLEKINTNDSKYADKLAKYVNSRKELHGIVTNLTTHLNIVFAITYNRSPILSHSNGRRFYNFDILTAMVNENYGSDSDKYKDTLRFYIR